MVINFIVQALRGDPLTLYGDGRQTRSFCYVSDLIEGLIRLMNGEHSGPINLGNPAEFTIRELAELIRQQIRPDLPLMEKPLPQDDPRQRQPAIDLAREQLTGSRLCHWTGLAPTIESFRSLPDWPKAAERDHQRICCIGAGYVGGPTMAVIAALRLMRGGHQSGAHRCLE